MDRTLELKCTFLGCYFNPLVYILKFYFTFRMFEMITVVVDRLHRGSDTKTSQGL